MERTRKGKDTHLHTEIIRHLHTNNKAHTFSSHYSADGPLSNYSQPFSSPMCLCVFVDNTPPTVAISFLSHSSTTTFTPHRNKHAAASLRHTQRQKQHCRNCNPGAKKKKKKNIFQCCCNENWKQEHIVLTAESTMLLCERWKPKWKQTDYLLHHTRNVRDSSSESLTPASDKRPFTLSAFYPLLQDADKID